MGRDSKNDGQAGGDADGATRTLTEPGPGPAATPSSSGSLDGARFVPGTLLAGRYRIVGLLGRGGMGEVYRAEDLKLGEPVALKFLPAELSLDGAALARFHREVRVARQIAHRNVCRVFDIGEAGGLHFLSMEYIDGEDLSGLLKRIGRLPGDKAVELARQVCAGLEAAHEAGVLHRDVKPANVMIDGKGRAKITDFGLARVADELKDQGAFAGTPAYMAPEQIASGEVSVATDVYALGLVLYEMFTGQRAFAEEDRRELMARGGHDEPSRPSSHVEGLDPSVEAVILRCLEEDPAARPSSALEVSAALPGGDPLAVALAAGETPSPEMVAAAPVAGRLSPRIGRMLLVGCWVALAGVFALADRATVLGLADPKKAPAVLADRARSILAELGQESPKDTFYGLKYNYDRLLPIASPGSRAAWERLAEEPPTAFYFWYRESSKRALWLPRSERSFDTVPGTATLRLDTDGRLIRLLRAPEVDPDAPLVRGAEPDWRRLFELAGIDADLPRSAEPFGVPPVYADRRQAWEATPPGWATPIRIEAAAAGAQVVYFEVWGTSAAGRESHQPRIFFIIVFSLFFLLLAAGAVLARRQLKQGRGDRSGAVRLSLAVFAMQFAMWLLSGHFTLSLTGFRELFRHLADALLFTAAVWLIYVALEPFIRRYWPRSTAGWSRLLSGRFNDPVVGRELLAGTAASCLFSLAATAENMARIHWDMAATVRAIPGYPAALIGWPEALASVLSPLPIGVLAGLGVVLAAAALRRWLPWQWLADALLLGLCLALGWVFSGSVFQAFIYGFGSWLLILRLGLLAFVPWVAVQQRLLLNPIAGDVGAWYGFNTVLNLALIAGLAFFAYRAAVGRAKPESAS